MRCFAAVLPKWCVELIIHCLGALRIEWYVALSYVLSVVWINILTPTLCYPGHHVLSYHNLWLHVSLQIICHDALMNKTPPVWVTPNGPTAMRIGETSGAFQIHFMPALYLKWRHQSTWCVTFGNKAVTCLKCFENTFYCNLIQHLNELLLMQSL